MRVKKCRIPSPSFHISDPSKHRRVVQRFCGLVANDTSVRVTTPAVSFVGERALTSRFDVVSLFYLHAKCGASPASARLILVLDINLHLQRIAGINASTIEELPLQGGDRRV
jgi:hypothetical protein